MVCRLRVFLSQVQTWTNFIALPRAFPVESVDIGLESMSSAIKTGGLQSYKIAAGSGSATLWPQDVHEVLEKKKQKPTMEEPAAQFESDSSNEQTTLVETCCDLRGMLRG